MKRLNDVDISKGIGIFLVVLGHTCRDEHFNKLIYFFHLPLFFILSGFFFSIKKYNGYKDFLIDNVRSLILPYITFYILAYVYWAVIERAMRPGADQVSLITPIIGFFYGTDYKTYMQPNGALWFLMALFISKNFMYYMVKFITSRTVFVLLMLVSVLIGYFLSIVDFYKMPFSINSSFVALFFVGFGYLIRPYYDYVSNISIFYKAGLVIIALGFSYLAINLNILPDMDNSRYGNIPLFILGGASGTFLSLVLAKILKNSFILEYLGKNSLIIMGLSEPIKRAVIGVFSKIANYPVDVVRASILLSTVCTVLTLILLVPVIYIFTKHLYFLIGTNKK